MATVIAVAVALGATTLWSMTHWHDVKTVHNDLSQYTDLFQAHFGWGVFPKGRWRRWASVRGSSV